MKELTCNQTLAITSHRVIANDLNEHETVYGGRLLEMLDGTASISVSRLCRSLSVTAAIDNLNFIAPFKLQDSFCIESYVTGVGKRSIEVFVKIIGEHIETGERFLGLTAFLTFVVTKKNVELPAITPVTAEQEALCSTYPDRQKQRQLNRITQAQLIKNINLNLPWD